MAGRVVLITGQLLTHAVWGDLPTLLEADYSVWIADHGSADSIAAMALRLLAGAPETFHLIAHAMGGFVAFEVLRLAPERVRSLVLMSTLASADTPAQTERRMGYLHLVEQGRFAAVVDERAPILISPGRQNDAGLMATARQMALDTGADRFLAQQRAIMGRIDSRPTLPEIMCPVLILWGEADGITSADHQQEMIRAIPQAEFHAIPNCGHLLTLEQPETVRNLVADWLKRQAAA